MRNRPRGRAALGFLAGLMMAGATVLFSAPRSADIPVPAPRPLPYQSKYKTLGMVTCASSLCHGSVTEWKGSRILQTEYVTWSRIDKHAGATRILLNERSRKIAQNLGLKEPAEKAKICLDCHAHNPPPELMGTRAKISDGVTCEACHGPSEGWIAAHTLPETTHAQNVAHGLYPTDEPVARARLCLSCHFGNTDRFVTHRLMGAGHPRLSFELETFSHIGPSHFRVDADYAARKGAWNGAKVWAIGQALAVSETMKVLADPQRGRDGLFPELVLFDCFACHHQMSDRKWTARGPFGSRVAPGLVRLNDSNMVMLRAIMRQVDPATAGELTSRIVDLNRAVAGTGDVLSSAQAVRELAGRCVELVAGYRFDNASLRGVALALVDEGLAGDYHDYAAAEQSVMAVGSVLNYLNTEGLVPDVAAVNQGLADLRKPLAHDEAYRPEEFQAALGDFRRLLDRLPSSAQESHD